MNRMPTDYEVFESSSIENRRLLRQEELILKITVALSEALTEAGITKTELADRLGKTKAFVSQILAGGRNLTLRTIADVADALDGRIHVRYEKPGQMEKEIKVLFNDHWRKIVPWRLPNQPVILKQARTEKAKSPEEALAPLLGTAA